MLGMIHSIFGFYVEELKTEIETGLGELLSDAKEYLDLSGGFQAGIHVVAIGFTVSVTKSIKTGKFSVALNVRVGPGLYVGAGLVGVAQVKIANGLANDEEKSSVAIGVGIDGGLGAVGGTSLTYDVGTGNLVGAKGRYGGGIGASIGFDFSFSHEL